MATKRTPINRRAHRRITDEAVEAFKAGDHLRLFRALHLRPWEASPLDVSQGPRPSYVRDLHGWEQAQELQRQLEKASQQ
jgi:hypothetical protein